MKVVCTLKATSNASNYATQMRAAEKRRTELVMSVLKKNVRDGVVPSFEYATRAASIKRIGKEFSDAGVANVGVRVSLTVNGHKAGSSGI